MKFNPQNFITLSSSNFKTIHIHKNGFSVERMRKKILFDSEQYKDIMNQRIIIQKFMPNIYYYKNCVKNHMKYIKYSANLSIYHHKAWHRFVNRTIFNWNISLSFKKLINKIAYFVNSQKYWWYSPVYAFSYFNLIIYIHIPIP